MDVISEPAGTCYTPLPADNRDCAWYRFGDYPGSVRAQEDECRVVRPFRLFILSTAIMNDHRPAVTYTSEVEPSAQYACPQRSSLLVAAIVVLQTKRECPYYRDDTEAVANRQHHGMTAYVRYTSHLNPKERKRLNCRAMGACQTMHCTLQPRCHCHLLRLGELACGSIGFCGSKMRHKHRDYTTCDTINQLGWPDRAITSTTDTATQVWGRRSGHVYQMVTTTRRHPTDLIRLDSMVVDANGSDAEEHKAEGYKMEATLFLLLRTSLRPLLRNIWLQKRGCARFRDAGRKRWREANTALNGAHHTKFRHESTELVGIFCTIAGVALNLALRNQLSALALIHSHVSVFLNYTSRVLLKKDNSAERPAKSEKSGNPAIKLGGFLFLQPVDGFRSQDDNTTTPDSASSPWMNGPLRFLPHARDSVKAFQRSVDAIGHTPILVMKAAPVSGGQDGRERHTAGQLSGLVEKSDSRIGRRALMGFLAFLNRLSLEECHREAVLREFVPRRAFCD
ncbi:hypothetical protein BKA93DRAFT_745465 [Sparassis latifolia]